MLAQILLLSMVLASGKDFICSSPCFCFDKRLEKIARCRDLDFDHIVPADLPPETTSIILANVLADQLPCHLFRDLGLYLLTHINASHNLLETVCKDTFNGLPNLRKVDLSWNRLSHLDPNTFSDNPYLSSLDLRNNQLSKLSQNSPFLVEVHNLEKLYLGGNKLENLPRKAFAGMVKLRRLDLGANHLKIVDLVVLTKQLPALRLLELYSNPLDCSSVEFCLLDNQHSCDNLVEGLKVITDNCIPFAERGSSAIRPIPTASIVTTNSTIADKSSITASNSEYLIIIIIAISSLVVLLGVIPYACYKIYKRRTNSRELWCRY